MSIVTLFRSVAQLLSHSSLATMLLLASLVSYANAQGVDRDKNEISIESRPTPEDALKRFTTNVTQLAREGKLEPFVGERVQIRRILEALNKVGNKNTYILGEPGAGKSAMVEYAAGQLTDGIEMFRLDLNALEAGTGYRGMLEDRLQALLEAFQQNHKRILFIDEFHQVMRVPDFEKVFKPPMGRGEISFIGATTDEEYRDQVERDRALGSRGIVVRLPKPDEAKTLSVLRANKDRFEKQHGLKISDAALAMTARLAIRYYAHEPILRKALDIADRAMARDVLERKYGSFDQLALEDRKEILELELRSISSDLSRDSENYELKKRAEDLRNEISFIGDELKKHAGQGIESKLSEDLRRLKQELIEANRQGKLQRIAELTYWAIPTVEQQLREIGIRPSENGVITEKHIANFVAQETGIPSSLLADDDIKKLERLEKTLNQRVLGQNHVASEIVRRLKIRQGNVEPITGPTGVILLDGPTGTGKTEMAKGLAQGLFGDSRRLINIALNQYSWQSGSRLLGSDPGIKDSERGGELDQVRRQPFSVLNFDEFDKTPREIWMMLLQAFSDGEVKDPMGRTIDLRNTLIVASANFTAEYSVYKNVWTQSEIEDRFQMERGSLENLSPREVDERVLDRAMELKGVPPELRNRFHVRVIHNAIDLEKAVHIARTKLVDQRAYIFNEHKVTINFSDRVAEALAKAAFDPDFGVRPIETKRTDLISDLLTDIKAKYGFERGTVLNVDFKVDADQKGGALVAELNGSVLDTRQVVFKTLSSVSTKAGRQSGEIGRPIDPRDGSHAVERAVRSTVKK